MCPLSYFSFLLLVSRLLGVDVDLRGQSGHVDCSIRVVPATRCGMVAVVTACLLGCSLPGLGVHMRAWMKEGEGDRGGGG